ncbi:Uncharacterised protein [Sebaldella termitidis]|nr:Uncharacterised protein [Sebaldella termitidis]
MNKPFDKKLSNGFSYLKINMKLLYKELVL